MTLIEMRIIKICYLQEIRLNSSISMPLKKFGQILLFERYFPEQVYTVGRNIYCKYKEIELGRIF